LTASDMILRDGTAIKWVTDMAQPGTSVCNFRNKLNTPEIFRMKWAGHRAHMAGCE